MKLLAIDIESPNGMFHEGNICEFGYVLTDSDCQIIESENLLIKPIVSTMYRIAGLKLAYTMREYMNADSFIQVFPKIDSLLRAENVLVVGHAIHNDILCLIAACRVHGLIFPNITFIDSQIVFSIFHEEKTICKLDKIAAALEIDFRHHKADEDARLALLTLIKVCEKLECSIEELIVKYDIQCGRVESGFVVNCRTPQFTSVAPSVESRSSKKKLLNHYLTTLKPGIIDMDNKHKYYGKRIVLELDIEYDDVTLTRRVMQKIVDIGAKYLRYGNSNDILVTNNPELLEKHPKTTMTMQDFLENLGMLPELVFDDLGILESIRDDRSRTRSEYRQKLTKQIKA